jgi:tRNA U34 2-thiouridine synthase MnmA/TrmU
MATAAMKARANTGANGGTVVAPESVSMEFLIVEDNGGHFHWTVLDRDGNNLGRSPSYASHEDAEDAALVVLAGAGSARLDRRAATNSPLDSSSKTKVPTTARNGDGPEGRVKAETGAHAATTA